MKPSDCCTGRKAILAFSSGSALAAGLLLIALRWPVTLQSQQAADEKLVRANDPAPITSAVLISSIEVENQIVQCGLFVKPRVIQPVAPFQASNDWLRQMNIFLVNRTYKTIVSGEITLNFLDTGDCRTVPCATAQIHIGQMPAIDAYIGRTGEPLKPDHPEQLALNWKPGQTIVVHIGEYMEDIQNSLAPHMPVTAVRRVAVHVSPFLFEDGMRWGDGSGYALPDPEHPGRFKYLPDDYFPGEKGNNWPPGYRQ